MDPLLNATIGEYRLTNLLGAGGMGEVYRAVHTRLDRVAAVKVLTQDRDAGSVQRFLNEARIQASLRHPGVVTLYDFLEYQGRPCIVMEYVEGPTLADRIRQNGPLPPAEAVSILRRVTGPVGYIHACGVIHRDLKSSNIKLDASGVPKLLDFGIARAPGTARVTRSGSVVGTLENLAPEQIRGQDADARSEIWALGVLLFEMLTGRLPFQATTIPELYSKIQNTPCPLPSQLNPAVPPELDAVVLRCLNKDPNVRYQSAAELERALGRIDRGFRIPAFLKRRGWLAAALAAAAGLALWIGLALTAGGGRNHEKGPGGESAALRTVTVDIVGGVAEVYRNGRFQGPTPLQVTGRVGEKVELLLKREGFEDKTVQFEVSERQVYTEDMSPARN